MTSKANAILRLPDALKSRSQWAVSCADKAPMAVDASGKLRNVSVTAPSEWLSFAQALEIAERFKNLETKFTKNNVTTNQIGLNIGFILNEIDPFTCIDLDVKDAQTNPSEPNLWTTAEQFDFYWRIVQWVNSYTEKSKSGKGLHIWVEASIGAGFRRNGVEVYSQERFIICTGDAINSEPIAERQSMLDNMVSQMRPVERLERLKEVPPIEDDWSVLRKACEAFNSDKFWQLWNGNWQNEFPSQSEADLALMSMLTFYSPSNMQCRRLFRESELGKREKAVINDRYLNLTLKTIRGREAREQRADVNAVIAAAETMRQVAERATQPFGYESETRTLHSLHAPRIAPPPPAVPSPSLPPSVATAGLAPVGAALASLDPGGIPWPPGLAGHIAQFIYQNSPRPVKEVSIVAALGLLAGITGKAWHIPQSGLNLYMILVARSAVGKEAMHSGISSIIKACTKQNPSFHKFVDFTEYASGPALTKACVANPCFVNVSGEWGRRLKRLAYEDGRDGALQTLRTQMTNLYQKSGPAAIVGGIGYSATENNVESIAGVSYSIIGETTPGTFYDALTESMMEDGFLSRFLVVEYGGQRPAENEHRIDYPDLALVQALNALASQADMMIMKDQSQPIGRSDKSAELMKAFDLECDEKINETKDESRRQMWNRAALKSLRIAGVLAVGENWLNPIIEEQHIEWAQDLVRRDIAIMKARLEGGDVGQGDNARERKLMAIFKDYLKKPVPLSYKIPDEMRKNNIIPRSYLQVRVNRVSAFYNHRFGINKSLDDAIISLTSNGYIMQVSADKLSEKYNYHGKAFRIIKLQDHEEEAKN